MNSGCWFETLRAILELLYFVAGIVIAGAAIWGLQQIRLTKRIAIQNAKREGLKFAAERCQYFAEFTVPLQAALTAEHNKFGFSTMKSDWTFQIVHGEIVATADIDLARRASELAKLATQLTPYLNSMEAFAIPFAAGVADDELGFRETAYAFCEGFKQTAPMIFSLRRKEGPRYESSVRLYECWSIRLEAEKMKKQVKDLQAKIGAAPDTKIKPVDGV
jgi:hypothetical protein